MLRDWLRLFRAQTAPATILLILVPYLANADLLAGATLTLGMFALLIHWASFGHNSLMDTAMGHDTKDPSKGHHPLVAGRIGLETAHNLIHPFLCGLAIAGIAITLWVSPAPVPALTCLFLWYVFGNAYNSGLSKTTVFSFLPISLGFTLMGAWAWLLSHPGLGPVGTVFVGYIFLTILFQISWSGHLKEIGVGEGSNLLIKMGARLRRGVFDPGASKYYGCGVKLANLALGGALLYQVFSWQGLISLAFFGSIALYLLRQLTKRRKYMRDRELMNMSLMEVATIFLPVVIVVPLAPALVLMALGVFYFFSMNKLLWAASYPRV